MEEEKMMTKEHMEAELKSLKIKRMIARILAVCAVLMAIFMAITEDPTIALVFLVIALVLWLLTSRATKRSDKIGHALDNVTSTEQMDTRLQFMRIKVIILRILTHGLLVTGILAVSMNFFITLACLIIAPVFGIPTGRAIRRRDEVKEILGRRVSSSVVRDVLGYDVEYDPAGALTPGSVVIPPHYDRAKGTHHISTVCNGVNIEMGSIMLLEDTETTDAGGNPLPHVNVQFRGPWVICDYGRKPACRVFISERTKKDYPAMKSNVKIENEPFGSRFCVRAKDPQEAYKILTPRMMEAIFAAADKSGGTIYLSFLTDGKTHAAIHTGHDLFDTKKGCNNAEGMYQKFSEELRRLITVIDTLNV